MSVSALRLGEVRGLLFDLDGTLLDSFSPHFEAYKSMFARFGIELTERMLLDAYSPNWYHTYEMMGLPRERWGDANNYWLEAAALHLPDWLPGVREALEMLAERFVLGLVTSGSKRRVIDDLERTRIDHLFDAVVTGDDIGEPKPSPEGLLLAMERLALHAGEVVYVGDACADYEMACAAGVGFLCVTSPFTRLRADQACPRMESVTELLELLRVNV